MAGVHCETLGQGRGHHDFDYTPLSDPQVVLRLMQHRMAVDAAYAGKTYPSGGLSANGGIIFVENIINTYIDLDRAIADARMSAMQRRVTALTMLGWTASDIAEEMGVTRQTVNTHQMRAVEAIVRANNERWGLFAEKKREC